MAAATISELGQIQKPNIEQNEQFLAELPKFTEIMTVNSWDKMIQQKRGTCSLQILIQNFSILMGSKITKAYVKSLNIFIVKIENRIGNTESNQLTEAEAWNTLLDKLRLNFTEARLIQSIIQGFPEPLKNKFVTTPSTVNALIIQMKDYLELQPSLQLSPTFLVVNPENGKRDSVSSTMKNLHDISSGPLTCEEEDLLKALKFKLVCKYCGKGKHTETDCRKKVSDHVKQRFELKASLKEQNLLAETNYENNTPCSYASPKVVPAAINYSKSSPYFPITNYKGRNYNPNYRGRAHYNISFRAPYPVYPPPTPYFNHANPEANPHFFFSGQTTVQAPSYSSYNNNTSNNPNPDSSVIIQDGTLENNENDNRNNNSNR